MLIRRDTSILSSGVLCQPSNETHLFKTSDHVYTPYPLPILVISHPNQIKVILCIVACKASHSQPLCHLLDFLLITLVFFTPAPSLLVLEHTKYTLASGPLDLLSYFWKSFSAEFFVASFLSTSFRSLLPWHFLSKASVRPHMSFFSYIFLHSIDHHIPNIPY